MNQTEVGGMKILPGDDRQVILTRHCYRRLHWLYILFNLFFDGFAAILVLIMARQAKVAAVPVLVGLVAVIWTWISFTKMCNRTTVTLSETYLERTIGPIPFFSQRYRVPIEGVSSVALDEKAEVGSADLTRTTTYGRYNVTARLDNGKSKILFKKLDSREEALFARDKLDSFLSKLKA